MDQESELQRLEKFVEKLLTRFSALKAEKAQLEQDVFERDLLIEELRDNISSKVTERNQISERVNKIVDQIEEWELNLENSEATTEDSSSTAENTDENELLAEIEAAEETSDEDERRVQHDLFAMSGSKE
jgi:chromosome segregation ATPase